MEICKGRQIANFGLHRGIRVINNVNPLANDFTNLRLNVSGTSTSKPAERTKMDRNSQEPERGIFSWLMELAGPCDCVSAPEDSCLRISV